MLQRWRSKRRRLWENIRATIVWFLWLSLIIWLFLLELQLWDYWSVIFKAWLRS